MALTEQTDASVITEILSLRRHSHWLLRAALGSVFLTHGWSKLTSLDATSEMLGLPVVLIALVAIVETLGGTGILVSGFLRGLVGDQLTRLSAASLVPVMLGAIAMFHWGRWFFTPVEGFPMGGMEFQITLLVMMLYFVIEGNIDTRQKFSTSAKLK